MKEKAQEEEKREAERKAQERRTSAALKMPNIPPHHAIGVPVDVPPQVLQVCL